MHTHTPPAHRFEDMQLSKPLLRALAEEDYRKPTEIQQSAIPLVLAGRDLLATAQTGTGKTAAFALPLLQLLESNPPRHAGAIRVLVLTPTRELAVQIDQSFKTYGKHLPFRTVVLLGGVNQNGQITALRKRPDILVATPGRLLDLHEQGHVRLDQVERFVLDEADRMLDMGFIHDVRRIASLVPGARQTLLFSATLPDSVADLASRMLKSPARVQVTPVASVSGRIEQHVYFVEMSGKLPLLIALLRDHAVRRALIFTRTKRRANRLQLQLVAQGQSADVIHSNKSQNARQRALDAFSRGSVKVLVGTDVVARGIDVEGITHVFNYELPNDPESYVHRIGRTARAGADGIAVSFCSQEERGFLRDIESLTRTPLKRITQHPDTSGIRIDTPAPSHDHGRKPSHGHARGGHGGGKPAGSHGARPHGGKSHGPAKSHVPVHPLAHANGGAHGKAAHKPHTAPAAPSQDESPVRPGRSVHRKKKFRPRFHR